MGKLEDGQRVQTCRYKVDKIWGSDAQHGDYSEQHCIIYLKVAKRVDHQCSHHKREMTIMWAYEGVI